MDKKITAYLDGGHVRGPGTGTSDSIAANLSNGEFVVKADVVKQPGMLEFLKKLNSENYKFKDGGFVDIARKYADYLAPGQVQYDTDNGPVAPIESSMVPTMGQGSTGQPIQNQIAPPPNKVNVEPASMPETGINNQVLMERVAAINNEPDEAKKAVMKTQLAEQLRNLQAPTNFKDGGLATHDDLFEDVPYQEASAPQTSEHDDLFEDVQHPDSITKPEAISKARSALVGAGQGATLGFGEELTAPVVAAAGMTGSAINRATGNEADTLPTLPGEDTLSKFQRLMQQYRDVARQEQKSAQEQNPGSYMAGAIGGGLLTPGLGTAKVLGAVPKGAQALVRAGANANLIRAAALPAKMALGAGTGAAFGGIAGAGEAEGNLEERLPGAEEGAKTGAIIGGAIPAVAAAGNVIGELGTEAGKLPIVANTIKNFQRGTEGENLITSAGRRQAANIVRNTSSELYNDIKSLQTDVGDKIGAEIKQATESGTKLDLTDDVNTVLDKLQKIKAGGSKEAAAYADSVEAEIKKVLKLNATEAPAEETVSDASGQMFHNPEPQKIEVTPEVAQDLKQVLQDYSPRKGMAPQELEPARAAKELKGATSESLSNATENLPELNEQYGSIKDSLKRLGVNEKRLPEQIKEKINDVVSSLGNENTSGDTARAKIEDVLNNIREVSPEIADKYASTFDDIGERLTLANHNMKTGFMNTIKSSHNIVGNALGLTARKMGKLIPDVSVPEPVKNFASQILNSSAVKKGIITGNTETGGTLSKIRDAGPTEIQRQVANAAEDADPDTLKSQAQNVRTKYGKSGEQLATILDNMSDKDKGARRALMFTILQNQAYRRMLGLTKEEQ